MINFLEDLVKNIITLGKQKIQTEFEKYNSQQNNYYWVILLTFVSGIILYQFVKSSLVLPSSSSVKNMSSSKSDPSGTSNESSSDRVFQLEELKRFDGSDPNLPIYVSIKGIVFDVTSKREVYGPGGSYHIFAGKDGSKGLGMSSLDAENAIPDYSQLDPSQLKVLDDWVSFFRKRYNVVGHLESYKRKL